jgi:hypothetical protein
MIGRRDCGGCSCHRGALVASEPQLVIRVVVSKRANSAG